MNSTDLHTLPAAPPVSRAVFFTLLLTEPDPQSEPAPDEQPGQSAAEAVAPAAAPALLTPTGFPA